VAALGVSAVLAAVDLIASRIQMMAYAEVTLGVDGLEQALPMGQFLRDPSSTLAPDEWLYQGAASYLLFGKVAGYITARGANGWPSKLDWLNPDHLTVTTAGGVARWAYCGKPVDPADLVIRRWAPMIPGCLNGVAPVAKLSVDIQRALKAALFERDFFDAGGLPLAVLKSERDLKAEDVDTVNARYDATRTSRGRKPLVLGKQWSLDVLRSSPVESGVDAVEKRIATKVANIYHVPPEWVGGESGGSLTYDNPDMNTRLLDGIALQPVYTMLERMVTAECLPTPRVLRIYPESILRSDPKSAAEIDERLVRAGLATPNERRKARGLGPQAGADDLLWPPYSTAPKAATTSADAEQVANAARTLQQLYLAVGKVITAEEARAIVSRLGVDLPGDLAPNGGA
jgi:HK97 family phage portal protein